MQRTAIVVGAGLAGLSAADALVTAGWDVTVLEAKDRVGGRTWSDVATNGARIERGAEWVEDEHRNLIGLCDRFALPLVRAGMSYHDRRPVGGPPVSDADLVAGRQQVRELLDELGEDAAQLSVADALAKLPVSDGVRVAFRARVECTAGAPASDLAATHLDMLAHAPDDADSLRIGPGSDAPARALADGLGSRVRLGEPVVAVCVEQDGVEVTTATDSFTASRLVLALPAAVLRRAPFVDVLPSNVAAEIAKLGDSQAAKLFIPLTAPTPPEAHLDVHRNYWVWTANDGEHGPRPIVAGFVGSLPMIERLEVANGPNVWAERVAEMRPDLPLDLEHAGVQTWHDDPYARSVYACVPSGAAPNLAVVRQTHGPLVLAGEYTDDQWAGYMEGAVRSGLRAAQLLEPGATPPRDE